jgi:phosphatidylglycerol:prolipoprotein diacylglycerol transferase
VNQELYGAPTNLPWAIFIEPAYRLPEYKDVAYYHPMFLYESLWNLLLMAFLLVIGRKFAAKLKTGDIFLMYLVGYPLARFMLEFIRLDPSNVGGINANQTLMAVIALSSAAVLIYKHFIMRSSPPPELTTLNSQEDHGKE